MNEDSQIKGIYSWPAIVLLLIFFWPIGVYLLIKRISLDKKTAIGGGKTIRILGIISFCLAAIGLIAGISDGFDGDDIALILFFGIAGCVLMVIAGKTNKQAQSIKKYLSIIVNANVRQLDTIASSTGKSYDVVKTDIQKMIDKGYLRNAYINEGTREVVLPDMNVSRPAPAAPQNVAAAFPQTRIVSCVCCGANNAITGPIGECEYCGSPLK